LAVDAKFCCVKELIDHIWTVSSEFYTGTDREATWMTYHDHLSTMWEKGAIEYMKEIGLWDRLIKITGSNNALVCARYQDSLAGNSPENARGTDSHQFAKLMQIAHGNAALTTNYPEEDDKKFSLSKPKRCQSAMERAWSLIPGEDFVRDIYDWPRICDVIIAANGTIVQGEGLRSGKRAVRLDGTTHKAKTTRRDRKSTLIGIPVHPDAQKGLDDLLALGDAALEAFEMRVAADVAQAEIEADKERAEFDEYFNPDDADDDPDEEAPLVGFEDAPDATYAPVGP